MEYSLQQSCFMRAKYARLYFIKLHKKCARGKNHENIECMLKMMITFGNTRKRPKNVFI